MRGELDLFGVTTVVMHSIPAGKPGDSEQGLVLSEAPSPLTKELANYFASRIQISLRKSSFDVFALDEAESVVPGEMRAFLADPHDNIVPRSAVMARLLHEKQHRSSPAGWLCAIAAVLNGRRTLAVMKLEIEEALRLNQIKDADGLKTFDLQRLPDLTLHSKTQVYKVGLFELRADGSLAGLVSDHQAGRDRKNIAGFFLKDFLGCQLVQSPDVITRTLYELLEGYINDEVQEPVLKAKYETAALAELGSSDPVISPRAFVESHFEGEHRQGFIDHLEQQGFPTGDILKDTSLFQNRLHRVHIELESGISVCAPPELMDEIVQRDGLDDNTVRIEITGSVRDVKGGK